MLLRSLLRSDRAGRHTVDDLHLRVASVPANRCGLGFTVQPVAASSRTNDAGAGGGGGGGGGGARGNQESR